MALMVSSFYAEGYRSLMRIAFQVERLNVFVGANGVGKTNLYRALQLLQAAASGQLSRVLIEQGGMDSVFYAGERAGNKPVRIVLRVELSDAASAAVEYEYRVEIGLGRPTSAAFRLEPQIKEESLLQYHGGRTFKLLDRHNAQVKLLDEAGVVVASSMDLLASETALANLQDPDRFPALHTIRRTLTDWRFYHDFRTDAASALRQDCFAVTSPTLEADGSNLAAVFATLAHIRQDTMDLDDAIEDAFPGAAIVIPSPERMASFGLCFADYPKRVFNALELSDGTLRYLALVGVLLAYRLPSFIALNEPETSLHPDLLAPLARLIVRAAQRTQVWLVTHSDILADALAAEGGIRPQRVIKADGKTWMEGLTISGEFREPASGLD